MLHSLGKLLSRILGSKPLRRNERSSAVRSSEPVATLAPSPSGTRREPFDTVVARSDDESVLSSPTSDCNSGSAGSEPLAVDVDTRTAIESILEKRFPNGIRANSPIDVNKLRGFVRDTIGKDVSPDMIGSLLSAIGVCHGGKVYFVSSTCKKRLADLIDRLIGEGNRLYCYDEFYDSHSDVLQAMNVFSPELLRTVLSEICPSLYFARDSFSTSPTVSVESEVLRCYDAGVCLSYEQLKKRLPYVPKDRIRHVLAFNSEFIRVEKGVYTHVSKVEIDEREGGRAEERVLADIADHGFASLAAIDVSLSIELNPELSEAAIRKALFDRFLADRFDRRGNVITPKGTEMSSTAVLKHYCLSHDRLSLAEIQGFETEINGGVSHHSLSVAYDTMIRVDKETFVSDQEIQFDVDATDHALDLFVNADVVPLQQVTSFTSFPSLGRYRWNLYVLESYCRRFSRRFMYQSLSPNSRHVGAILRRSAGFTDYVDALAHVVATSNVELIDKAVGDYLFDCGYIAQRTGAVTKVVRRARMLREGGA